MGKHLAAWIDILPEDHRYRSCLKQIADVYSTLDDFEPILADFVTSGHGSRAESLGVARSNLLSDLNEAIRHHFDAIRSAPTPLYDTLVRDVFPGDIVITFNYDLAIERALRRAGLWDVRTGYGFVVEKTESPSPVEVLKLHGSTNWRALLFGGKTGLFAGGASPLGERPVLFFRPDLAYLGYPDFVDPKCSTIHRAASLPAMIMPALPKQFYFTTTYDKEWRDFWDGLWMRAGQAIARADELVVIGYSLPTANERARSMLLETDKKGVRLSICCGQATTKLEREFRDHGFNGIDHVATTFEDFLTSKRLPAHRYRGG